MPSIDRAKKLLHYLDDIRPVMTTWGFEKRAARRARSTAEPTTITVSPAKYLHTYPVPEVTAVTLIQFDERIGVELTHSAPGRRNLTFFRPLYSFPADQPITRSEQESLVMLKGLRETRDAVLGNIRRRAPDATINISQPKLRS